MAAAVLAESAAIAASVAMESNVAVQDVDYFILCSRLEMSRQKLSANGFRFAIEMLDHECIDEISWRSSITQINTL